MSVGRVAKEFIQEHDWQRSLLTYLSTALLVSLIALDRYAWALLAQWREDQATTIWIALTRSIWELPVGLVSSTGLPNPNGMMLFSLPLSHLPSLASVSFVLGIGQALLVCLLLYLMRDHGHPLVLAALVILGSTVLRATSVELWGQWLMTSLNLLFLVLIVIYRRSRSICVLPLLLLVIMSAPALYLVGLLNAIVFFLIAVAALALRPPSISRRQLLSLATVTTIAVLMNVALVWIPYFQAVPLENILAHSNGRPLFLKFGMAAVSATLFLPWSILNVVVDPLSPILQNSTAILRPATVYLKWLSGSILLIQASMSTGLLVSVLFRRLSSRRRVLLSQSAGLIRQIFVLAWTIPFFSCVIAPLLNGPVYPRFERPDQAVQFLPLFLLAWFVTPFVVYISPRIARHLQRLSFFLGTVFILVNLMLGASIYHDHIRYRGNYLPFSDVPLDDKRAVVDFIATDWKQISSSELVPVAYDLGGGKWNWVPEVGERLQEWYPAAMTTGRSYDFELLRIYGLYNTQEGHQHRSLHPGRYLVTYRFSDPPTFPDFTGRHYYFDRLRVTIYTPRTTPDSGDSPQQLHGSRQLVE